MRKSVQEEYGWILCFERIGGLNATEGQSIATPYIKEHGEAGTQKEFSLGGLQRGSKACAAKDVHRTHRVGLKGSLVLSNRIPIFSKHSGRFTFNRICASQEFLFYPKEGKYLGAQRLHQIRRAFSREES